jgi:hypothetical protein
MKFPESKKNSLIPHYSRGFYSGLANTAAKLVSAKVSLNILSSMPRSLSPATTLFASVCVASYTNPHE